MPRALASSPPPASPPRATTPTSSSTKTAAQKGSKIEPPPSANPSKGPSQSSTGRTPAVAALAAAVARVGQNSGAEPSLRNSSSTRRQNSAKSSLTEPNDSFQREQGQHRTGTEPAEIAKKASQDETKLLQEPLDSSDPLQPGSQLRLRAAKKKKKKKKHQQQPAGKQLEQERPVDMMASYSSSLVAQASLNCSASHNSKNLATCRYEIVSNHDDHRKQNHCEIEKRRRDKMNHYIMELASVIPSFTNNQSKFDKLTVLRMAVQHVKSLRSSLCSFSSFHLRPSFLSSGNLLKNLILQMASQEAQDNLFMVVTCDRGKVLFVSQSSKHILHQDQSELVGQCLFDLLHKDDVLKVKEQISYYNLMPREMLVDSKTLEPLKHNGRQSFNQLHQNHHSNSTPQPGARRSFFCRIKSGRQQISGARQPLVGARQFQAGSGASTKNLLRGVERRESSQVVATELGDKAGRTPTEPTITREPPKPRKLAEIDEDEVEENSSSSSGNVKGSNSSLSSSGSENQSAGGNSASNESSSSSSPTSSPEKAEEKKQAKSEASIGQSGLSKKDCSVKRLAGESESHIEDCSPCRKKLEAGKEPKSRQEASQSKRQQPAAKSNFHQGFADGSARSDGQAQAGSKTQGQPAGNYRSMSKKHWRYIVMHCTGYLKSITLRGDEFDEDDFDDYYNGDLGLQAADDENNHSSGAAGSGKSDGSSRTIDCLVAVCRRSPMDRDLKPDRPLTFTCRYSMEGKFVFVDQRTTVALGYTPQQLLGTSHYAYCHKDSVNTFKECHRQSILKSEPVSSDIYQFKRANGQHLWLQTSLKSFRNPWTKFIDYIVANHTTAEGNEPHYNEGCVPTKFNQDMTMCGEVSGGGGSQSSSPASSLSLPSMDGSSCCKKSSSSPSSSSIESSYSMDSYNSAASGGIQALLQQIDRVKSGGGPAHRHHLDLHKLHHSLPHASRHQHHAQHHHHHHHHHHHQGSAGSGASAGSSGSQTLESGSGGSNSGGSARKSNEDSGNYSDPQSCSSLSSHNSALSASGAAEFVQQVSVSAQTLPAGKRAAQSQPPRQPQLARARTSSEERPSQEAERGGSAEQMSSHPAAYFQPKQPARGFALEPAAPMEPRAPLAAQPAYPQQLTQQVGLGQSALQQQAQYTPHEHPQPGKVGRAGAQAKNNQRISSNNYTAYTPYRTQMHDKPAALTGSQWEGSRPAGYQTVSGARVHTHKMAGASSEVCAMPAMAEQGGLGKPQQAQRQPHESSYQMTMVVRPEMAQPEQQSVPMQTGVRDEPVESAQVGFDEMMPYQMGASEYEPALGTCMQEQQQPGSIQMIQHHRLPTPMEPISVVWNGAPGRCELQQHPAGARLNYQQPLCAPPEMMSLDEPVAEAGAGQQQLMQTQERIVVHCQQCASHKCSAMVMPGSQLPAQAIHQPAQHLVGQQQPHQQQQHPQQQLMMVGNEADFTGMNLTSLAVDGDYDEDQLLEFLAGYDPGEQLYNIQDTAYQQYNVYR